MSIRRDEKGLEMRCGWPRWYLPDVIIDRKLFRLADILVGKANLARAEKDLGRRAQYRMKDVIHMMIQSVLEKGI
jgi:GDP-D-mannose dehydratase